MKINYYEVLGVERSASEQEIRDRFRKLARESHPDRYKGNDKAEAERRFQTLTEAVNVLTNENKRKAHDAELSPTSRSGPVDMVQIAKAYIAKGVKAYKENDFVGAYEQFDMAVKHNDADAKAHHYLAMAAARIPSRLRQAVQAAEAAVQRDSINPAYLKDAGLLCKRAGLNAKAERYLEEALKWDKDNEDLRAALSELRSGRGDTKDAGKGFGIFRKS
ncbi:MAG TPA: DnaJ domain-containing protein [Thermoanaerobaculia bacterium]|nr:DnaJ domain-containing protein [Thermoanaerobaculia bacterium]